MFPATWLIPEILVVIIFAIVGWYAYYKLFVFNFWRKNGVYYLEPTFPTGNIMPIITGTESLAKFFRTRYECYKDHRLLGLYMFHKPCLMVNDLDLIKEVLTKQFTNFHDRGVFYNEETDPLSGNLFQLPGRKWRNLRVKLTPTFTSGKMKQMFAILRETGNTLEKFLEEKARSRGTFDAKDVFTRYSVDIIMSAAFGISCDSFNNPDNEFRYWGKRIFTPKPFWNALVMWAPQILNLFSIPYTERALTKFFINTFSENVKYREANNIVRKDFLNLLMQLMKDGYVHVDADETSDGTADASKGTENKLTMKEAASQAYVFYLAGFETSSTTITFCLYELALHQDIQDKVREEMSATVEKFEDLTYDALNNMTYLHKVVSETLRKYPAVVVLNRICSKESRLDTKNFAIPEGTPMIIPVFGIHRDSNLYPEPEKFDPERFSEENIKTRHPYAYLPFGEGPRICIGSRFGLVQTKVALISTLLKNRIKLAPGTPTSLQFQSGSLILIAEGGVHLTIEPA